VRPSEDMKTLAIFALLVAAPVFAQETQDPKADDFIQVWGTGFRRDATEAKVIELLAVAGIRVEDVKGWEPRKNLFRGTKLIGEVMFGTPLGHTDSIVVQAVVFWALSDRPEVVAFAHTLLSSFNSAADQTRVQPRRLDGMTVTSLGIGTLGKSNSPGNSEQWAGFPVGQRRIVLTERDGDVDGKPFHSVELDEYVVSLTDWLFARPEGERKAAETATKPGA
jgi:hypothetical protein